jgi:hypothetical protein
MTKITPTNKIPPIVDPRTSTPIKLIKKKTPKPIIAQNIFESILFILIFTPFLSISSI